MRTPSANANTARGLKSLIAATAKLWGSYHLTYDQARYVTNATALLERGMPLEQIQKFPGHAKLETTQLYAESTPEMIKESYQRALAG